MPFDFEPLKDILVCPQSKAQLILDGDSLVSVDPETRLKYSIQDGIPIMLVEEAVELPAAEWGEVMQRHGRDPQSGLVVENSTAPE